MLEILHITAHLGGGVGKILSSIAVHSKRDIKHTLMVLEPTQTPQFEVFCRENDIELLIPEQCHIETILEKADIVQIDWWHHPLTMKFMSDYLDKVECRLLIWSHISGCSYPNIPKDLVMLPEAFIFSTPFSYENPSWSEKEKAEIKKNSHVVISSGIDSRQKVVKEEHAGFNIGYIGFLSYNKTHPHYVKFCEAVAKYIPVVKFYVVGDTSYGKQLMEDTHNSIKIKDKVVFTGYSLDVQEEFQKLDVFGYPLNPKHYGTAENVLLEAMAAGIPPVVLNQCTEKYIVQHNKTGLIVNTIEEYAQAMKWLWENPRERYRLGDCAHAFVMKEYYIETTIKKMNKIYNQILSENKKVHHIKEVFGYHPYDWFKTCYVGDVHKLKGSAFAETKGSAKHYLKYFSYDTKLREVVKINESRSKT